MGQVVDFPWQKCECCEARGSLTLELTDYDSGLPSAARYFCGAHFPRPLTPDELCLLVDKRDDEIAGLQGRLKEIADLPIPRVQFDGSMEGALVSVIARMVEIASSPQPNGDRTVPESPRES